MSISEIKITENNNSEEQNDDKFLHGKIKMGKIEFGKYPCPSLLVSKIKSWNHKTLLEFRTKKTKSK